MPRKKAAPTTDVDAPATPKTPKTKRREAAERRAAKKAEEAAKKEQESAERIAKLEQDLKDKDARKMAAGQAPRLHASNTQPARGLRRQGAIANVLEDPRFSTSRPGNNKDTGKHTRGSEGSSAETPRARGSTAKAPGKKNTYRSPTVLNTPTPKRPSVVAIKTPLQRKGGDDLDQGHFEEIPTDHEIEGQSESGEAPSPNPYVENPARSSEVDMNDSEEGGDNKEDDDADNLIEATPRPAKSLPVMEDKDENMFSIRAPKSHVNGHPTNTMAAFTPRDVHMSDASDVDVEQTPMPATKGKRKTDKTVAKQRRDKKTSGEEPSKEAVEMSGATKRKGGAEILLSGDEQDVEKPKSKRKRVNAGKKADAVVGDEENGGTVGAGGRRKADKTTGKKTGQRGKKRQHETDAEHTDNEKEDVPPAKKPKTKAVKENKQRKAVAAARQQLGEKDPEKKDDVQQSTVGAKSGNSKNLVDDNTEPEDGDPLDDPYGLIQDDSAERAFAQASPAKPAAQIKNKSAVTIVPQDRVVSTKTSSTKIISRNTDSADGGGQDTTPGEAKSKPASKPNAKILRKQESLPASIRSNPEHWNFWRHTLVPTWISFIGCVPNPFDIPDSLAQSALTEIFNSVFSSHGVSEEISIATAIWHNVDAKTCDYRFAYGNSALSAVFHELVAQGCNTVEERAKYAEQQLKDNRFIYEDQTGDDPKKWKNAFGHKTILKTLAYHLETIQGALPPSEALSHLIHSSLSDNVAQQLVPDKKTLLAPRGALAMAATAVERAWDLYSKRRMTLEAKSQPNNTSNPASLVAVLPKPIEDTKNKISHQFSHKNYGAKVFQKWYWILGAFDDKRVSKRVDAAKDEMKRKPPSAMSKPKASTSSAHFDVPTDILHFNDDYSESESSDASDD
ncbi:hypothetical protein EUX98_g6895 [Antrodiella citrinella]|uniref:Uncharacterized protein n=1 Tax=Antrodiella citrinella TaxID=2447956 RepID=A0A4V3XI21_9APHY|nr:hypothetical protein EUX98_g6895 [Antrodiella citrinella]